MDIAVAVGVGVRVGAGVDEAVSAMTVEDQAERRLWGEGIGSCRSPPLLLLLKPSKPTSIIPILTPRPL